MSKTTTNYKLIKPELTDVADITAMNKNWDIIDSELATKGNGKIVTGTYTGTGKNGINNKNLLSFKSTPKLLIVMPEDTMDGSSGIGGFIILNGVTRLTIPDIYTPNGYSSDRILYFSWGDTVSWYCNKDALYQYNTSGKVYRYLAIL